MHVMTRDYNDEWVNIYRKQKAHGNSVYLSPKEANPEHMANQYLSIPLVTSFLHKRTFFHFLPE